MYLTLQTRTTSRKGIPECCKRAGKNCTVLRRPALTHSVWHFIACKMLLIARCMETYMRQISSHFPTISFNVVWTCLQKNGIRPDELNTNYLFNYLKWLFYYDNKGNQNVVYILGRKQRHAIRLMCVPCMLDVVEMTNSMHWLYHFFILRVFTGSYVFRQ
jgi:hypothetical protein